MASSSSIKLNILNDEENERKLAVTNEGFELDSAVISGGLIVNGRGVGLMSTGVA